MLELLFGNKNIQTILLFLFVNGKCYGSQLQRAFQTSLTPIQKAFIRLEKAGVITSYLEGKTRVYQFNPGFPLLNELESLIKKAYTFLSPKDKLQYAVFKQQDGVQEAKELIIQTFWTKLLKIKKLNFEAKTKNKTDNGWNGKGIGEVNIIKESDTSIIFNEKGKWLDKNNQEIVFTNSFRWTLHLDTKMIALEHLRRGIQSPVFLIYLTPTSSKILSSVNTHLCEKDTYFGQLFYDQHSLRLHWRAIGPKKNEEMNYYYI